ncbi:hypothetical protein [Rhodococcus sp. 14-2483-1-2]|uniref:hypothetical protein n=1 Tax=Rhodococcus sp. 14-2483-1-2 TaxID=2023147 RepID=UPI000B9AEA95|nr:hypothetical protein [Rhodococcus sp. 14-2483-1-2]OZF39536.1 hypothetical protein CH295_02145 [Rhodococcus sp. 14-2483-1-2]
MSNEPGSNPAPLRFLGVPVNEIPAMVPLRLVLAHTDTIAVWLTGAHIYSRCVTLSVDAAVPTTDRFLGMYGFGKPESGRTPPMLIGFEDAQGTVSTNLPGRPTGLQANGGNGSGIHGRIGLVLTALPAPGPMNVHFAWPYFGIDETRFTIDADEFLSAADQVTALWDEPDPETAAQIDMDNRETPEIEIPEGGWFAAAAARQKPPPRDPNAPRRINFAHIDDRRH